MKKIFILFISLFLASCNSYNDTTNYISIEENDDNVTEIDSTSNTIEPNTESNSIINFESNNSLENNDSVLIENTTTVDYQEVKKESKKEKPDTYSQAS